MILNKKISAAVLIGGHQKVITQLEKRGIRCIILEDNPDIDFSVRNHADMSAFMLSDKRLILDKRQAKAGEKIRRSGYEVIFTRENISGAYPSDIKLNAAMIGDTVICLEKYVSREIIDCAENIISVKQGYSKCSVCVVGENAFITDDINIYKKCKDKFDVLLIDKGDICLENKEYGFIGGASGLIGGKIYFFGSLDYHRDGERIKDFLQKHRVCCEYLFDGKLIDIGGVIELV